MAIDFDPYAVPTTTEITRQKVEHDSKIYRQGDLLVFHKKTFLPERCVKTNQPTTHRLKRTLIQTGILSRHLGVYIGLSKELDSKRHSNLCLSWLMMLIGMATVFSPVYEPSLFELAFFFVPLGLLLVLIGGLISVFHCRVVHAKRIRRGYIYLKGVCPAYLAEYEQVPRELHL